MDNNKQWYINYFNHMEEEDKKIPLGGMAWDDLSYHADKAIKYGYFTIKDLKEQWPQLWGWLKEEEKAINSNRYINYDKLLNKRKELGLDEMSMISKVNAFNIFIDNLSKETVEIKTGEWIDEPDKGIWITKCSNCNTKRPQHEFYLYCPDCGALMENGE